MVGGAAPYQLKSSRNGPATGGRAWGAWAVTPAGGARDGWWSGGEGGQREPGALPQRKQVCGPAWRYLAESLILAQDKRWRRALRMQVERQASACSGGRVSNTYVT